MDVVILIKFCFVYDLHIIRNLESVQEWMGCGNFDAGNIFNWTNANASLVNTVESNVSKDDLCSRAKPGVVPCSIEQTYELHTKTCMQFGGKRYTKKSGGLP